MLGAPADSKGYVLECGQSDDPLDTFNDILCGESYLNLVNDGTIGDYDTVLMLSINGTQLHEHKESNSWIYIRILVDLGPDERYKI